MTANVSPVASSAADTKSHLAESSESRTRVEWQGTLPASKRSVARIEKRLAQSDASRSGSRKVTRREAARAK
jgi:hypothetical protein